MLGYFVDLLLIGCIWMLGWTSLVFAGLLTFGLLMPLVPLLLAVVPVAYHTLMIGGPWSGTVGMKLFDTEVRSWTGRRPSYWQALLMTVTFYASIGVTGLLILLVALFTPRHRTLHDILSGTVVVRPGADAVVIIAPRRAA